ncbi:DUF456 domain-containing protein [Chloroflexota bacterium]
MVTVLLAILCSVLMLVGLIGVFVLILPGIPLAWLGLFIYAIGTGFERISIPTVVVFFVLMVLITAIDFIAPIIGAKKYEASRFGILGAFLGLILGIITLSFWGIIIGPFIGALGFELIAKRRPKGAFRAAVGTFVGFIAGTLIKVVFILIMSGLFIASWF